MEIGYRKQDLVIKILLIDFWGLGDLILATGAVRDLQSYGVKVGILTKPVSRKLVEPTFPNVCWHEVNIPWTVHRGKYRLHEWHWKALATMIFELRKENYDCSVSIRADPREDIIPHLAGIKKVYGYRRWNWWKLITHPAEQGYNGHRVERWQELVKNITEEERDCTPRLRNPASEKRERILLHVGASVKVRRWFLPQWQEVIDALKKEFSMPIEVIADLDGFGKNLEADRIYFGISLEQMCDLLGGSHLVIGNDSGPTHIASAYGVPTVTVFGPQKTQYFRPWSEKGYVVEGGECEYKPCSDYCKFDSPKCLESVTVNQVMGQVRQALEVSSI